MRQNSNKLNPWHYGTVASINSNGTLNAYIDGSNEITPSISYNPDIHFRSGDRIWILYINGNSRNLFAFSKRKDDSTSTKNNYLLSTDNIDADTVDGKHAVDLQNYNNLTNKPKLMPIATTGSYNDLTNKPVIPVIPPSLPANGGNADTLNNIAASGFLKAKHAYAGDLNDFQTMEQIVNFSKALCTNCPPTMGNWGGLINLGNISNTFQQIVFDGGDHNIYTRLFIGWSAQPWKPWQKLWHSGNHGANSGLDADTVDGKQADHFLLKSGGEMAGSIAFTDVSRYWLYTAKNWGIYWNTQVNDIEFRSFGLPKAKINLGNGNISTNGTITSLGQAVVLNNDSRLTNARTANGGNADTIAGVSINNISRATNIVNGTNQGSIRGILSKTNIGDYSMAIGDATEASGTGAFAMGWKTAASGHYAHAVGRNTKASNWSAFAEGINTIASGQNAHAAGYDTIASQNCQFAIGYFNKENSTAVSPGNSKNGTAFLIGNGTSAVRSNCFRVQYNGAVYSQGAYNTSGADYAELFEWEDGNPNNEDRRGLFVTLKGNKITFANSEKDFIVGIISSNPAIIGNNPSEVWKNAYLTDMWGNIIQQTKDSTTETPIVNPKYNPQIEYMPRHERKEWGIVGMFGQLIVKDDGTAKIGNYCQCTSGGTATKAENGYYVMERLAENYIKILFK